MALTLLGAQNERPGYASDLSQTGRSRSTSTQEHQSNSYDGRPRPNPRRLHEHGTTGTTAGDRIVNPLTSLLARFEAGKLDSSELPALVGKLAAMKARVTMAMVVGVSGSKAEPVTSAEKLMTAEQVPDFLGTKVNFVHDAAKRGELEWQPVGRYRRFTPSAVARYLAIRRGEPVGLQAVRRRS